jgi:hypothetical protein
VVALVRDLLGSPTTEPLLNTTVIRATAEAAG